MDPYDEVKSILKGKPVISKHNDFIDSLYAQMAASVRPTIKVVHIADFHADPWYVEGAIADCGGPYCCRNETYLGKGSIPAGKFGVTEDPCDIPLVTVQSTLDYIKVKIKPDMVIWTGDNSPHDHSSGVLAVNETA